MDAGDAMTLIEVYNQSIKPMPAGDRLMLATMILNDLAPQSVVDYQDAWSDEDLADFSAASWQHAPAETDGHDAESR